MTDDQITTLAREYAEEMIKGKSSEELPNCLKNSIMEMNTEYVAEVFQWLTRRYALVEKSKVEQLKQCFGSEEVYEVIDMLFPDIAKEVEE